MTQDRNEKAGIIGRIDRRRASTLFSAFAAIALVAGFLTTAHGEPAANSTVPAAWTSDHSASEAFPSAGPRAHRLPRNAQRQIGTAEPKRVRDGERVSTAA
jgi:hypothetical protein